MVIQFSNAKVSKASSYLGTALLVSAILFFFVPATLIVLGYYASQPTGTLLSPLPQTVVSDVTPTLAEGPVVAAPNDAIPSALTDEVKSNATDFSLSFPAGRTEVTVTNTLATESSQITLLPQSDDHSVYYIKSKGQGVFTVSSTASSDLVRTLDYQIVNP